MIWVKRSHIAVQNALYAPISVGTIAGMLENDDPREAIDGFNQVVTMEGEKGEW